MKIIKNKNIISEKLSENTFILNNETGVYIELNESASALWNSFETITTTLDLEEFLIDEYEIDSKTAKNDVSLFVKECILSKLILNQP